MESNDLAVRLEKLKKHYGTTEDMISQLQRLGLKGFSRSTLYRWINRPLTRRSRAGLVVQLLEKELQFRGGLRLKIAEPRTVLALPSTLVRLPKITSKKDRVNACSLLQSREVAADLVPCYSGGEALDMLLAGEAHVAIAAAVLVKDKLSRGAATRCVRLCTLSRGPFVGIAVKPIKTVKDLTGLTIGIPDNSSGSYLYEKMAKTYAGLALNRRVVTTAQEAAIALRKEKNGIDAYIGWDSAVADVQCALGESLAVQKIPAHILNDAVPELKQDIAVNLDVADPRAVRVYLECLSSVVRNLKKEDQKTVSWLRQRFVFASPEDLIGQDNRRNDLPPDKEALKATTFLFNNFKIDSLLALWGGEAAAVNTAHSRG